jgi:YD repeat-containing protein
MKEEYVLQHFLLPDGQNHSGEEYEGPELAVNVMNGNVVYRERDLKTTSQSGRNLELERIYNSQQPVARDGQWGHGWSLAQTPEFKPETAEATKAKMLQTSAVTNAVDLPKTSSETSFSTRLHATVAKTESGTYEVRSASSDETQIFNSAGRIEEARLSNISPEVTVPHEPVFPLYAESIGSPGSGNGQLSNPADVVVDAKGNTWVVDKGNNRIVEFNEAGEFIRGVGSLGSGAGQLKSPSAIAIDTWGNLDVADTGNNRVVRFSSEGAFQSVVGANVNKTKVEAGGTLAEKNRCAAGSGDVCQAGTSGSGEGLMAEPVGIATSAGDGGLFYVVERANNRVEKFNLLGELQAKFGSLGSGNGQLKEPSAIAIGPNGLWVADTGNNRIEKWSFSWVYQSQFGTAGSGNGQFKSPAAVEVDASGNVWVGDQGNQRVQELSPSGDYITQFGGEGQFQFSSPMGIFLDSAGDLWVTDSQRGQVQEWMTGSFLFAGSRIGSSGTGNSQFSHPADVALDGKGNLWALDKGNNRLEKFNEKGEFVAAVGAKGGAAGQLNAPSALAIDPSGNLWVADTANNRIEEWSEAGQFVLTFGREVNKTKAETAGATEAEKSLCTAASGNVCQAGVAGSANGQLNAPLGVATTSSGNLWVADTANNRIQKFGPTGSLINVVNGSNTPAGTMKEPAAIAMGPDGSIWVADTGNNRIEQWSTTLSLTRYFGSEGTGNGRFKRPAALDIDSEGNVWVGDQNNERIQQFTSTGEYVAQLGSSAQFAFSAPMGLAADNKGGLWLTDTDHNRVQRILTSEFAKPVVTQVPAIHYSYSGTSLTKMELKEPEAPDPAITVATTSGLATSASSEADTATYSYTSGKLTTSNDSEGETKYEYDAGNRIKKITLPNGTWASVTYDSTGRATKVIVKPAGGTEKTTNFKYEQEPRRTYVWGNEDPEVIYYFGEDGSLLKWENAATPPTIASITGSLWGHRNDPNPIENKDQTLFVTAESQNEIASIKVLSGNAVLAEQSCEDKSEPPAHNCDRPPALEWIPNPSEFPPGRLDLEIVATDFQEHSTAERFFVTMPQQPPPNPEAPEKPNFKSIKLFREENGLDRGKALTEAQSNRLILELLYEWEAQFPAAVAAVETFGVPMRTPELGEMEYRRSYLAQAAEAIPLWAEEHSPTTYGGYYVDNREGGIIYVGFTQNQSAQVEALKQSGVLNAPGQVREMPSPPTRAIVSVESLEQEVITAIAANSLVSEATEEVSMDSSSGLIEVNALAPGAVRAFLTERFGASAPISVQAISSITTPAYSRFHSTGPVHAGDWLQTLGQCEEGRGCYSACTANFGGYSQVSMLQGQPIYNWYKLTAGHCFGFGTRVKRKPNGGKATNAELASVGQLERSGWSNPNSSGNFTDFEAIHVNPELSSSEIFYGNPAGLISVNGAEHARLHREYCWSGANGSARECGIAYKRAVVSVEGHPEIGFWVLAASVSGDSGGPVWDPVTKKAVGIISGHNRISKQPCVELLPKSNKEWCPRTFIGPLLPFFGKFYPDGGLEALGVELVNWK